MTYNREHKSQSNLRCKEAKQNIEVFTKKAGSKRPCLFKKKHDNHVSRLPVFVLEKLFFDDTWIMNLINTGETHLPAVQFMPSRLFGRLSDHPSDHLSDRLFPFVVHTLESQHQLIFLRWCLAASDLCL